MDSRVNELTLAELHNQFYMLLTMKQSIELTRKLGNDYTHADFIKEARKVSKKKNLQALLDVMERKVAQEAHQERISADNKNVFCLEKGREKHGTRTHDRFTAAQWENPYQFKQKILSQDTVRRLCGKGK